MLRLKITVDLGPLRELQRQNTEALRAITEGTEGITARAVLRLRDAGSASSPWLTGTLSTAHRGDVYPEQAGVTRGVVYIDPAVVNPVFGGYPSVYGPIVHRRKPWLLSVAVLEGPGVLNDAAQELAQLMGAKYG